MNQIYHHRVYRELQTASRIQSDNIVRYFNSWFEELNAKEKEEESEYMRSYQINISKKNAIKRDKKLKKRKKKVSDLLISPRFSFGESDSSSHSLHSKSLQKFSFGKKSKALNDQYAKKQTI